MSRPARILRNSISSIVTLLVGVFIFVSIPSQIAVFDTDSTSTVNARTLPYLISSAIIILSLLTIISNAIGFQKSEANPSTNEQPETTSYIRVFFAFAAIAFWIILLPYLGFNIATILLVASVMIVIGDCRWWQIALLSLILSVPVNYLLATILRVYLPRGILFD